MDTMDIIGTDDVLLVDGDWFLCRASYLNQESGIAYKIAPSWTEMIVHHLGPNPAFEMACDRTFLVPSKEIPEKYIMDSLVGVFPPVGSFYFEHNDLLLTGHRESLATKSTDEVVAITQKVFKSEFKTSGCKLPVIFFSGKQNWRYKIGEHNLYKAERANNNRPLHLDALKDAFDNGYICIKQEPYEADDLIAHAAMNMRLRGNAPTKILSADRDFELLPHVQLASKAKDFKTTVPTPNRLSASLERAYYKVLVGDKGDNIIGPPGIGPGKAKNILDKSRTAKEMYVNTLDKYVQATCTQYGEYLTHHKVPLNALLSERDLISVANQHLCNNLALISMGYLDGIRFDDCPRFYLDDIELIGTSYVTLEQAHKLIKVPS